MIIGSHNSWSYLKPKRWWLRPFTFMAKCQDVDIRTLYEWCNVRCFDLRLKFDKHGRVSVAHGWMTYTITLEQLILDLNYINSKGDCYVRVLHEVRCKCKYTLLSIEAFQRFCIDLELSFRNTKFWCGRNLYNWNIDYRFMNEPSCEEKYSSVCKPRIIDDWYPKLYAKMNNGYNIAKGTDRQILLIDFVDIQC